MVILSLGVGDEMLTVAEGSPHIPPDGPSPTGILSGRGASTKSLKVAKEPRWHFVEYIYSHFLLDIKIAHS